MKKLIKINKKGFTLFEIMLSVAIIGLIVSIAVVAINSFIQLGKADNASRWSGINTIHKALDQYYISNGVYPSGIPVGNYLEICDTKNETTENGIIDCTGKVDLRLLVPDYVGSIPRDPKEGGYKIGVNSATNKISLWADKAQLGDLISINPMDITLEISGVNVVGNILNAILGTFGLDINQDDIIWYTVSGGVETEVGKGLSYTVKPEDEGKEIIAKIVLGKKTLALDSGGNAILLTSGDKDLNVDISDPIGFDNIVRVISTQSDGKMIVVGDFTTYRGASANRIIRLNSDGSRDDSFNVGTGFNNIVYSNSIQSDGKIIVSGSFTSYQGVVANRIIRLNSDGSRDNSFNIGTGFNNIILTSSVQSDGKVVIGGSFTTYQGVSANRIIRLNSDGSRDNSFNVGTGFSSNIRSITIQSDGRIIIGGDFTTYQGVSANRIIRLNSDGSRDNSFNIGIGFNNIVYSIASQSDGKVIVGGSFTTYQGVTLNRIVRLNSDGSRDNSFNIGTGFNNNILSINIATNGKVIIGGAFTTYQGVSANRIIRLNSDGSRDNSFNIGTGFSSSVNTILIQTDSKLIIGGAFITYQGLTANRMIRVDINGSTDSSLNLGPGLNGNVRTITGQSDGKTIIGGEFITYQGESINRIMRLNTNGSRDNSFNVGTGFNNNVLITNIQNDGKIIVGGDFTNYQGVGVNRIIRLNSDGSRDNSFNLLSGFNGSVNSISIQNDGKLIVGGGFTAYQGGAANRIIRLNINGSRDNSFNIGTGFNGGVLSIGIQGDGKVIIGGSFTTYQGITANRIIRLNSDGSRDNSFNIGTGISSNVRSIIIQNDGKVIVGGDFTNYQGVGVNRIIRLNSDGSRDNSFNIGTGFNNIVYSISTQNDGKLIIGGSFTTYQGAAANRIIRLNSDGSRDNSFNIGTGFNNQVLTSSIQNNNKIMLGGSFTNYKGQAAGYLIGIVF